MNNAEGLKMLRDAPDFSALKDAILGPAARNLSRVHFPFGKAKRLLPAGDEVLVIGCGDA